jgi:hypothetical protein
MFRQASLVIAGLLCLAAAPLLANEAEDAFNMPFGDAYRKAIAKTVGNEAVALAAKVLEAAQKEGTPPGVAILFCEKAHELGIRAPGGYKTAAEAMEIVADLAPERGAAAWEKVAEIRRKQYAAAKPPDKPASLDSYIESLVQCAAGKIQADDPKAEDVKRQVRQTAKPMGTDAVREVEARLLAAEQHHAAAKSAAELTPKVDADPKDAVSRNQLVRLLVVDLDDPKKANLYVNESCDEQLRKFLPALARDAQATPELTALDIARWYVSLSDEAGKDKREAAKGHMLIRARRFFNRYLEAHAKADAASAEVISALGKLGESLSLLTPAMTIKTVGPGRWVDLACRVDPARDTIGGRWQREGKALAGVRDDALALPCVLDGAYEILATCLVPERPDCIQMVLPIASATVGLSHDDKESNLLRNSRRDSILNDRA